MSLTVTIILFVLGILYSGYVGWKLYTYRDVPKWQMYSGALVGALTAVLVNYLIFKATGLRYGIHSC